MSGCYSKLLLLIVLVNMGGCRRDQVPEVVVYVAVDRVAAEPILREFETRTGTRVKAVYDAEVAKTTGLVMRLLAEAKQPRADVFWNNELAQTRLLAERGVLDRFTPATAHDLPAKARAPDGYWTAVGRRARVIVYNTRFVPPERVPRSLFDLTRPEWHGQIAIANPQFGTTRTHVASLFAALGPDRAQQYLRELLANQVRIVDGNAMVMRMVARAQPGASPVYLGLTDTDDVMSGQSEGEPIDFVFPDQDQLGTLVMPTTVCLLRGAPHSLPARQLIEYLVSPEVELRFTGERSGYWPQRQTNAPMVRELDVESTAILRQLEPSSRWTQENFHP